MASPRRCRTQAGHRLEIGAVALREGAGRAPVEDLHDYAAVFTAGSRAAAADLAGLELAIEEMWESLACAAD